MRLRVPGRRRIGRGRHPFRRQLSLVASWPSMEASASAWPRGAERPAAVSPRRHG